MVFLVPHAFFLVLILVGLRLQEVGLVLAGILALVWGSAIAIIILTDLPLGVSSGMVALLDIFLVLKIFGMDIRIPW